jgi:hypothetical protein
MIQFRVNDTYLDLPTGFNLSLKYTNSCFAFDKMELNRSQEFSIPATQKNNKLFQFANNPSNNGDFIRRVYVAELYYDGGGVIRGELRIIKFDSGSGYNAIFTWGELTNLQKLREKGSIKDNWGDDTTSLQVDDALIISAYLATFPILFQTYPFRFIRYQNGAQNPLQTAMNLSPTLSLKFLLDGTASRLGVNIDYGTFTDQCKAVGIILSGNKRDNEKKLFSISGNAKNGYTLTGDYSDYFESAGELAYKWQNSSSEKFVLFWKKQKVKVFVAKKDIVIKKANYVGGNLVTIVGDNELDWLYPKSDDLNAMAKMGSIDLEIPRGKKFTFISMSDWGIYNNFINDWWVNDFDTNINVSDIQIQFKNENDVEVDTDYPLYQNLPDVTIIDILKTYANLLHCGIDYNVETNTISFFDFNFNKANAKKLEGKVVSLKSIDRKFSDYAQVNEVAYKSEEYVVSKSKIVYRIDNQTLPTTKTLYTIPFSDGDIDSNGNVLVKDFDLSINPPKKTAKQATICLASPTDGQNYLKHISKLGEYFVLPNTLDSIVMSSTTVILSIICQPKYFLSIKNTDTFEYRSVYYCCLSATYSNGIAELTLVKI